MRLAEGRRTFCLDGAPVGRPIRLRRVALEGVDAGSSLLLGRERALTQIRGSDRFPGVVPEAPRGDQTLTRRDLPISTKAIDLGEGGAPLDLGMGPRRRQPGQVGREGVADHDLRPRLVLRRAVQEIRGPNVCEPELARQGQRNVLHPPRLGRERVDARTSGRERRERRGADAEGLVGSNRRQGGDPALGGRNRPRVPRHGLASAVDQGIEAGLPVRELADRVQDGGRRDRPLEVDPSPEAQQLPELVQLDLGGSQLLHALRLARPARPHHGGALGKVADHGLGSPEVLVDDDLRETSRHVHVPRPRFVEADRGVLTFGQQRLAPIYEVVGQGDDVAVVLQRRLRAVELPQHGQDACDAVHPRRRLGHLTPGPLGLRDLANGVGVGPHVPVVGIAGEDRGPPGPVRRVVGVERLVERAALLPAGREQVVDLLVDRGELAQEGAEAAARLDDETPDVAVGAQQLVPALPQVFVVQPEQPREPVPVGRARQGREHLVAARITAFVHQGPDPPVAPPECDPGARRRCQGRPDAGGAGAEGGHLRRTFGDPIQEVADGPEARRLPGLVRAEDDCQSRTVQGQVASLERTVALEAQLLEPHLSLRPVRSAPGRARRPAREPRRATCRADRRAGRRRASSHARLRGSAP